ncbi:GRIP and coiled-coil domain-containing protein 2 [Drosophila subpulchrella]|uniref:GRIP and coiled-coil domain-containing protein 2 n=1 Tax=Drosophila subpulchrella TaxID=1486046 RepID=UPI0018A1664A|nr:GRIP and coiled-coil domain-containing protein 2 [Drosophila subpulchrella]
MEPKVSIASLLLLLSAIKAVENQPNTHNYESLSTQKRTPSSNEQCEDYNDISSWMKEQLNLNSRLRHFQRDLDFILSSLNKTTSPKMCYFYEENTLKLVINQLNAIQGGSGTQIGQLESNGDLESSLEIILPQIRNLVPKGIQSCCENFGKFIKKIKDDLGKRVKALKRKLKEVHSGNSKENDALQKKLKDLENQIEETKRSLEMLQKQMGDNDENTKCCSKLGEEIQDLDNKLRTMKSEAVEKTHKLDNQLKNLKDKQGNGDEIITIIKQNIEDGAENIKNILSQCDKNCVNKNSSEDKNLGNKYLFDLEKKTENLQMLVETLSKKFGDLDIQGSTNLSVTLNTCLENGETFSKIQSHLQYLEKQRNEICSEGSPGGSGSGVSVAKPNCSSIERLKKHFKELQKEGETLRRDLKKFSKCCEKIDDLNLQVARLESLLKEMNQTYNDHLKDNSNQIDAIRKSMDDSLKKLGTNNQQQNSEDLQEQMSDLKKVLDQARIKFEILKDRQDRLLIKKELTENSTYSPDEFAGLKKDFEEFNKDVDGKLKDLDLLKKKKKDAMAPLQKFKNEVSQDLDKIKKRLSGSDDLGKQVKDQIEDQKKQANLMLDCKNRCMNIDKMDDLIDRVEDMEKLVNMKKSRTRRWKRKYV